MKIMNKVISAIIIYSLLILFLACNNNQKNKEQKVKTVDFHKTEQIHTEGSINDTTKNIHLAIASMTSPKETLKNYAQLIKYIENKLGVPIKLEQHKTYEEVNSLLELKQLDVAFICSGAYVEIENKFPIEILATPVVDGKLIYNAYIIAHKDSDISNFLDFKGKSFAFTDPLSNTGKLYAVKRVKQIGSTVKNFFNTTIYTYAHDYSIQAVSRKIVDGATVHSLIFNYIKVNNPEKIENIKIIEVSEDFGIPPVVVHANLNKKLKKQLQKTFLSLHENEEGKKLLKKLMIDKFVSGQNVNYSSIKANQKYVNK